MPIASICLYLAVIGPIGATRDRDEVDVRCGARCLYVGLKALGLAPKSYKELERSLGEPTARGYSLLELENEAKKRGACTLAVQSTLEHLSMRKDPYVCLSTLGKHHYVLIIDIDNSNVHFIDPPGTGIPMNRDAFRAIWDHKALLLAASPLSPVAPIWFTKGMKSVVTSSLAISAAFIVVVRAWLIRKRKSTSINTTLSCVALSLSAGSGGCGGLSPQGEATPVVRAAHAPGSKFDEPTTGQLAIDPPRIQLGKIFRSSTSDSVVAHAVLKNLGANDLRILETLVSCDCTEVKLGSTKLGPQTSTSIDATIRLGDSTEPRSTSIRIRTDQPAVPPLTFRIDWQVINPLTVGDLEARQDHRLKLGESKSFVEPVFLEGLTLCPRCSVNLTANASKLACRLEIGEVPPSSRHETPAIRGRVRIGTSYLTIKPQVDPQFYRDEVIITLSCGGEERARYLQTITWNVVPVVAVAPNRISSGVTIAGEIVHQSVILRSSQLRSFRIIGVQDDDHRLHGKVSLPESSESVQVLNLEIVPPRTEGPWRSMIHLLTDHPEASSITIPISGIVEKVEPSQTQDHG